MSACQTGYDRTDYFNGNFKVIIFQLYLINISNKTQAYLLGMSKLKCI